MRDCEISVFIVNVRVFCVCSDYPHVSRVSTDTAGAGKEILLTYSKGQLEANSPLLTGSTSQSTMLRLRALAAALALALAVPARARSSQNQVIAAYRPLRKHPELFDSSAGWRQWIDAALLEAIDTQNMTALQSLMREEVQGVHSFQLFNDEFAQFFLEELDNYRATGLPINRPNSMNNYVRSDVRCSCAGIRACHGGGCLRRALVRRESL